MSIKFKSNIESEGKIIQSKHRAIKHTDTVQTLEVKVVTKTAAHPEYQTAGSSNYGYTIDGVEGAYLELTPGITYRFDQSDGSNGGTGTGGSANSATGYVTEGSTCTLSSSDLGTSTNVTIHVRFRYTPSGVAPVDLTSIRSVTFDHNTGIQDVVSVTGRTLS